MTQNDQAQPPADASTVTLEHWVYGASPERGYGTKSESTNLNGPLYTRYLGGHFTPVRVEKTASGSTIVDARMLHPAPANNELLLSILGRGVADEYNRPTIANHTVVLPVHYLRSGRLTFADVEAAALEFDRRNPKAAGKVDSIVVALRAPSSPIEPAGAGIRRFITRPALDTLVTRLLTTAQGRTLILCRGSTNQQRNELLYKVAELLIGGLDIPLFTAISDAPTLSAMNHFRVAISARGVRADGTWTLLDSSIDQVALPQARGKTAVYARIAEAFAAA